MEERNLLNVFDVYKLLYMQTCKLHLYRVANNKTEQSIFQDFALINSYLFSPCWIEHLFLIIITPRSSYLVESFFYFMSNFLWTACHFRNLPDFQSSEARLMTASAVHKFSEYCVQ